MFTTICADPPWQYKDSNKSSTTLVRTIKTDGNVARGVANLGYPTMTEEELSDLPIQGLAEKNAHLYLWVTNAFMEEGHHIARAWGFQPKTILTWGKTRHDDPSKASMKTGYYFRGATEHVIFAVRGSLGTTGTWPTLLLWPRIGAHSVKPDTFYDLVEQASPGPYLDIFSRRQRLGWTTVGNGIDGLDIRDALASIGV